MKYIRSTITTTTAGIELISAALYEKGIIDVEIRDPQDTIEMAEQLNASEWYDAGQIPRVEEGPAEIIFYREADMVDREVLLAQVNGILDEVKARNSAGVYGPEAELGEMSVILNYVDDEEWRDKWKEFFHSTRVSERIVVKPTWEEYRVGSAIGDIDYAEEGHYANAGDGLIVIEIDPGMAFGTGTHETTSLALKLLEKYLKKGDVVLDVGTGSGILSIAAAKLGASQVLGVDIDPEAVRTAEENFELNGVKGIASAVKGDLAEGLNIRADIIVANLLADLIVRLSPDARRHIRPGGIYISSGILKEKEKTTCAAIEQLGFKIVETLYDGEWCAVAARAE